MPSTPDDAWFTTRSRLFRPGDHVWTEVAAYADPIARLLATKYRWLEPADREDLTQTILIEIKERIVAKHDASRGRFRALLQAVVHRRVVDFLRRRRPESLGEAAGQQAAPHAEEVDALDLEVTLGAAFAACRDRFTQGTQQDADVLYALADRIVHGKTNAQIAAASGVSVDRVARLLRRGRDAVFLHLLARELEVEPEADDVAVALPIFRDCLRRPTERERLLETVQDARLRERLEDVLERFRAGLPRLDEVAAGELRRGLQLVLEP